MGIDIPSGLVEALRRSQHVLVFTGAGISADSGIATFRDPAEGLWERYDPRTLATPEAFKRDPALVWGWYQWRQRQVATAKPNAAHAAVASLETLVPKVTIVTQNVDDLHERAGSSQVTHLHGSLFQPRCFDCHAPSIGHSQDPGSASRIKPPTCTSCGGLVRPGVVWLGEAMPETAMQRAYQAIRESDVFLSVGTSGQVQPAASFPALALLAGSVVAHINTDPVAPTKPKEFAVLGKACEVVPALIDLAFASQAP